MARKGNRKRKPKSESRSASAAIALVAALTLSGFGLWRCLDDDADVGKAPPSLRAAAVKAVDVGPGKEVDPTIVDEQRLLEEEKGIPEAADAPQPGGEARADEAVSIDAAGGAGAPGTGEIPADDAAKFPLYAVAFHFHSQIFAEPKPDARVIGYARRGAKLRVGERVSAAGCKKGWHEVAGGGYLCDGQGVQVARQEVTFAPSPPEPELGAPLPYDYKYAIADDVPEYWRIPTPEETAAAEGAIAGAGAGPADERHDEAALRAVLARAYAAGGETDAGPDDEARSARAKTPRLTPTSEADAGDDDGLPAYVHQRMTKGYYVSTDDTVTENGATYARTVRGRFIPADKLAPAKASTFEGALVTERQPLPIAFVVAGGTKVLGRRGANGPLRELEATARYDRFPVLEELTYKGQRYVRIGENRFLPARSVDVARAAAPPDGAEAGERWIDVNLSEQTLVAYEGEKPVFATLVSTGREGHETPAGAYRIYGKHVTITMDDTLAGAEAYSIEDVPWTQYFEEGYALHAAFWHDRFGRVRSHGCVNLSPADARRLFFWTGPHLPQNLHGTVATKSNPGTRVVIHR
jgi:lipoprotein-anchoring transpeptidase ErfK/SrfK